jgi:hypothetical protein
MFNVAPVNANRKARHLVKAPASCGSRPKTPLTWRLQWSFLWSPANRDRQVFDRFRRAAAFECRAQIKKAS